MAMQQKPAKPRGTKILIASFSIAATLSGWAWLTLQQSPVEADESETIETVEPTAPPLLVLSGAGDYQLAALPTEKIPDLSKLPVRGLRVVSDATLVPPPTDVPAMPQASAPRERKDGGGGGAQVSAPQKNPPPPAPKPEPPPKPKRKTKSSK